MFSKLSGGESSQTLFDLGLNAYRNDDPKTAVDQLSEAMKKENAKSNPNKELLSDIHTVEYFDKTITLRQDRKDIILNRGDCQYQIGQDETM